MDNEFKAYQISERVFWVGAIDWQLRDFHGYNTSRGSTYNAFLIMGDEPILIDTVKAPFFPEMMARIGSIIDPKKIKYIVSNHAEMDHTGALPAAIDLIKPAKVFASMAGAKAIEDHFHAALPITAIKNGATLKLGNSTLTFLETKMLHWPDSMFSFFAEDSVLFSQDGFGMHLATAELFTDLNEVGVVRSEAAKYYANILLPFSQFVMRTLDELQKLHFDLKIIAPDHGPVWRTPQEIQKILTLWRTWSLQKPNQKAVIVYDTMWGSTAMLASAITDGLMAGGAEVKVLPLSGSHRSDIATEILEAGALLLGTPTINQQMFPTLADAVSYLKGLKRKNLIGQVFGSYGWAGEGTKLLQEELLKMQVQLVGESVVCRYVPTTADLKSAHQLGEIIARRLMQN